VPPPQQKFRDNPSHRDRIDRYDLRLLAAWLGVFCVGIALLAGAHRVYRLTGPHPHVRGFIRQLKHHARWFIPGLKGPRRDSFLPGVGPVRYADRSGASGHDAQRA